MKSSVPPVYRSDIKPLEFTMAILVGGTGSTVLSWLHVHGFVSVLFAATVMLVLAFLRWRIANESKDYQSLEAFAEDIYLLGYLLTLAALLGLAPRLMSDESNLFSIAGLKLVTTVLGLALMMIFRQTARRWAEEKAGEDTEVFIEQQKLFSAAVERLNQGADQLTSKLDEVVGRFDPSLLEPLADWSNRTASVFSATVTVLEAVPRSVQLALQGLKAISEDLAQVKSAAGELAGVLTAGTAQAAGVLTTELNEATRSAAGLTTALLALQPANESARGAVENLACQATLGANQLTELNSTLRRTATQIPKVEGIIQKMADVWTMDVNAPINRLAEALETSSATTRASTQALEILRGELVGATEANQTIAKRMEAVISSAHPSSAFGKQLIASISELKEEMSKTNEQIGALVGRLSGSPGADHKPGLWSRITGGR